MEKIIETRIDGYSVRTKVIFEGPATTCMRITRRRIGDDIFIHEWAFDILRGIDGRNLIYTVCGLFCGRTLEEFFKRYVEYYFENNRRFKSLSQMASYFNDAEFMISDDSMNCNITSYNVENIEL